MKYKPKAGDNSTTTMSNYFTRVAIIFFIVIIFVFVISFLLAPNDFVQIWQNNIYVIAFAAVGVAAVGALFIPVLIENVKEKNRFTYSEKQLIRETKNSKRSLQPYLMGLQDHILRDETDIVLSRINNQNAILLTGEAGFGKSGIGVSFLNRAKYVCLLFDVRRLSGITTSLQLSNHLGIQENILDVFTRLGKKQPYLLIFDQLDTISESESGNFIVELAIESKELTGISVVVISRHSTIEHQLLRQLYDANFEEIICKELPTELVKQTLTEHGMVKPSDRIVNFGKNILLLDLICLILKEQDPQVVEQFDTEMSIWEKYIEQFLTREQKNSGKSKEEILDALTELAIRGLKEVDRSFYLNDPPTRLQNRLLSHGFITNLNKVGRKYVFKVENLQDYLYARRATRLELNKEQVEDEICPYYLRNILTWMRDFYRRDNSPLYEAFLLEVVSG